MKILTIISLWLLYPLGIHAQVDSTVLSYEEYYNLVVTNHPVAQQADLLTDMAREEIRYARGNFDPKVDIQWQKKQYQNKDYYDVRSAALKVPTWFGITPEATYYNNQGEYLNPQSYIPSDNDYQQLQLGASLSLGRGLMIDKRRATLRKAQVMSAMTENERVKTINKLLLAASKDYWDWYVAYQSQQVLQESLTLSEDIYQRTVKGYQLGEVAMIDTVQAYTNYLTRFNQMTQQLIDLQQTALTLSNHLWSEDGKPLELIAEARPQVADVSLLSDSLLGYLTNTALASHPEIQYLQGKGEALSIDHRLAREYLKPAVDLKYLMINQPFGVNGETATFATDDNYVLGLQVGMPLFLRKERAQVRQADISIRDNQYKLKLKQREVVNAITAKHYEVVTYRELISQQGTMVDNYERLVMAERQNLLRGESDIFKLNAQIDKYLDSRLKYYKLLGTYHKLLAELYWTAGQINQMAE